MLIVGAVEYFFVTLGELTGAFAQLCALDVGRRHTVIRSIH